MRRLLAPFSRWLDRRIDARIAASRMIADVRLHAVEASLASTREDSAKGGLPNPPLTAEQIVRGLGFALTQIVNVRRHPSEAIPHDVLPLGLADAMGTPLPVETDQHGHRRLLAHGESSRTTVSPSLNSVLRTPELSPRPKSERTAPATPNPGEADA